MARPKLKPISEEEKRRLIEEELWYRGDLEYLLRENSQVPAYQFVQNWKESNPDRLGPIVWNNHRRWGKSYALVCLCVERCLRFPNQEVRFGAPTFKQAVEIVQPLLRQVLNHCPEDMYPEKTGGRYKFNNPRWNMPHAESGKKLLHGAQVLMELGAYPFSERYGWLQDKYGLSWQILYSSGAGAKQKITPVIMFVGNVCGNAEEAVKFWTSRVPRIECRYDPTFWQRRGTG